MIIENSNQELLQNDQDYQQFLKDNPSRGTLKIRVSSASQALPIENVKIVVSKKIGNNTIIFFDGKTDESGMINNISLPTARRVQSDLDVPQFTTYLIHATYDPEKFDKFYDIGLCCGVSVIQNINITPNISLEMRNNYGN